MLMSVSLLDLAVPAVPAGYTLVTYEIWLFSN